MRSGNGTLADAERSYVKNRILGQLYLENNIGVSLSHLAW